MKTLKCCHGKELCWKYASSLQICKESFCFEENCSIDLSNQKDVTSLDIYGIRKKLPFETVLKGLPSSSCKKVRVIWTDLWNIDCFLQAKVQEVVFERSKIRRLPQSIHTNITVLRISQASLTDDMLCRINSFHSLRDLALEKERSLTQKGYNRFFGELNPSLEKLSLIKMNDKCGKKFLEMLQRHSNLKSLTICNTFSKETFLALYGMKLSLHSLQIESTNRLSFSVEEITKFLVSTTLQRFYIAQKTPLKLDIGYIAKQNFFLKTLHVQDKDFSAPFLENAKLQILVFILAGRKSHVFHKDLILFVAEMMFYF